MKTIYKFLYLATLFAAVSSCDRDYIADEPQLYNAEPYVAFTSQGVTVSESQSVSFGDGSSENQPNVAVLEIKRSAGDLTRELTVNVSYTAQYVSDTIPLDPNESFNLLTEESITFEAGETVKQFSVSTVNDDLPYGNKVIDVTITSVSDNAYSIGYPGPNGLFSAASITIADDDCIFEASTFVGTYTVNDPFSTTSYEMTLELVDAETNTFSITNVNNWPAFISSFGPRTIQVVFNPDPTAGFVIAIPEQRPTPGITSGGTPFYYTGNGTYSPCSGDITLNYIMNIGAPSAGGSSTYFAGTLVGTKN
jgi:hypothetical protein